MKTKQNKTKQNVIILVWESNNALCIPIQEIDVVVGHNIWNHQVKGEEKSVLLVGVYDITSLCHNCKPWSVDSFLIKSIVYSFKLQQACEGKLDFI